ncbi:hypothetical protein CHS0354_002584 [Potamilus streckersoni]|uniref:THD domain-containing protein n=1 Tax=Potamilus streckersoni TaxID=2493646 RepID=A0AAE0RNQ1_9BIVA|nr:hypothetical protein CHS0354_002584 [Potamilus streckersoni]
MNSKQNKKEPYNGKHDSCLDRNETKRTRLHSTQSHESEVSFISQETATTGLSFETDSSISETKMTSDRSVSFCLANENEVIADDPCNDSESRENQLNNSSHNVHKTNIFKTMGYTNEETGQERMPGHIIYYPVNNSRRCSQNNCNEENCRQPLLRRQSTFSKNGTINEHPNDIELGSDYAHVQGNFTDSVHPCVCKFHHSQFQKLCSSVKLLKRAVFVLCVFNLILLIALIIVPTFAVLYIQAGKESNPGTGQLPSSIEQQRPEPSCVKCEYLMKMFPNFIKTQNVIESTGNDGKCCFSDPGKLMTIMNQISEEAFERAKGSISSSGPWISNGSEPTPAVHLKSRGNGLINVSIDFVKKGIESTHFVGWQRASPREVQGLWGEMNPDGASIKVKSSGMYFVYTMIQHKNTLKSFISENMTTPSFSIPPIPQKVTLYICQHGEEGVRDISRISQMYYSTDNRVQQNTYFGRIIHLKENDNLYLGISGYGFIHQESESHYIGFYKI